MSRRHLAILLTVSGLTLGGFAFPSYGQETCQLLGSAVIVGVNSVRTGTDVAISGDVVVNSALAGRERFFKEHAAQAGCPEGHRADRAVGGRGWTPRPPQPDG